MNLETPVSIEFEILEIKFDTLGQLLDELSIFRLTKAKFFERSKIFVSHEKCKQTKTSRMKFNPILCHIFANTSTQQPVTAISVVKIKVCKWILEIIELQKFMLKFEGTS